MVLWRPPDHVFSMLTNETSAPYRPNSSGLIRLFKKAASGLVKTGFTRNMNAPLTPVATSIHPVCRKKAERLIREIAGTSPGALWLARVVEVQSTHRACALAQCPPDQTARWECRRSRVRRRR